MTLTIYGTPQSRTMRTLWAAAELGLNYELVPLAVGDPVLKSAWFLALNPAGSIPTIVDDGVALAESLAINLHLAKKHGQEGPQPLYPTTAEAALWRWTLWAQGHLEPWIQNEAYAAAIRSLAGEAVRDAVRSAMASLERALGDRSWLAAEHFTIADLNVAAVLSPSRAGRVELEGFDQVPRWLAQCYARPAARAVRAKYAAPR